MSELANCPFCGTLPELAVVPETIGEPRRCYFVKCPDCLVETTAYDDRDRAIAAWNRRAPNPSPPEPSAGWRGIKSAPLDGTRVDLWRDGERLTDWRFSETRHGWFQDRGYPVVTVYLTRPPSHWMPVPADPPEAASPASGPVGELEEHKALSPLGDQGNGSSVADIARTGPLPRPETNSLPVGRED